MKKIVSALSFITTLLVSAQGILFHNMSYAASKTKTKEPKKKDIVVDPGIVNNVLIGIVVAIVLFIVVFVVKQKIAKFQFKQEFGEEEFKQLHIIQRFFIGSRNSGSWEIARQRIQRKQADAQTRAAEAQIQTAEAVKNNNSGNAENSQTQEIDINDPAKQ